MAPMLLDVQSIENVSTLSKSTSICSDPLVVPSNQSSKRIHELWWLHGHPHSTRYSNPKLVSLAALVRDDGTVYKGQKAFLFPISTEATTPYRSMTWDDFDSVTETIALSYGYELQKEIQHGNWTQTQPTVALLGAGKTFEYFCTQLALQKLGLRVLLLAESNASNANYSLLESCSAQAVIADSKNANIDTNGVRKLRMIESLPPPSRVNYLDVDAVKFQDFGDVWERHTFIIHSSGSTGMPKPITHTNRSMMLIARMYRLFQDFTIENWYLLFPLYHIAGISVALSGLPNGQMLSFPPLSWPPAASTIFASWKTLSSMGYPVECVHCAPTLIETMYEYIVENGGNFGPLASLKLLQPGGAVLSENTIRDLTDHGVNVKTTYGSTEIGPPFRSIPHTGANSKCYSFRNLYPDNPFLKMEQVGEGLYECVVYKGFELAADLWQGKRDNEPYRTNDLFTQDPPGSGFYVMQGRKDDILVHTNGENTSAGSLQLDIQNSSKMINKALALGHSLPRVSLLVEVHKAYEPFSVLVQENIRQAVQKVNEKYPTHSQITQSMIYVLPKGHTLPVTPKGNVRRKEAERLYSCEIAQLYANDILPSPTVSTTQGTLSEYLRNLFATVSKTDVSDVSDLTTLYDLGIDSRLALTIRKGISARLNQPISLSTIFENPSIGQLISILKPKSPSPRPLDIATSSSQVIERMISKLEFEFQTWPPRSILKTYPAVCGETVLLTGSTGSLASSLLETLSSSPSVHTIYAMVRGPNCHKKLRSSLESRGLDTSILKEDGKIKVLNFSMQDPLLGLDIDTYHRLAASVTMVVQNAWKMDFNVGVEEFQADCIRSTMSLLRFCYAGRPKRFAFTSSISTCMGPAQTSPVPEAPIGSSAAVALSTGYAQGKYIIERILHTASLPSHLDIPITLLRVGQLCGHTQTGHWNINEMFPIMFATSAHPSIRALPVLPNKSVDWIPVDIAASSITELLFSGGDERYEVHNIVNPNPISWPSLLSLLQDSLTSISSSPQGSLNDRLEEVSMAEWVSRLNKVADTADVPGLRLLAFFEDMVSDESASKMFETKKSREVSRSLRECGQVCGEWVERNVKVWRESGFL